MPLASSLVEPARMITAVPGEPAATMVFWNPLAIDSTPANTPTTADTPTIATSDAASRCGMLRMLTAVAETIWLSQDMLPSPQARASASMIVSRIARSAGNMPAASPARIMNVAPQVSALPVR